MLVAALLGLFSAIAWYYAIRAVRTSLSDTVRTHGTVVERVRRVRRRTQRTGRTRATADHIVRLVWDAGPDGERGEMTVDDDRLYDQVAEGQEVLLEVASATGVVRSVSTTQEDVVWAANPRFTVATAATIGAVLALLALLVASTG